MNREMLVKAQSDIANDFAGTLQNLKEFYNQVECAESLTGIEFVKNEWALRYRSSFDVTRNQLPALRKALGRLEMSGKDLANDFDKSNEVCVTVKPKAEKFNRLRFVYRTKFRNDGKCKVVEQESTKYKSLVCKV